MPDLTEDEADRCPHCDAILRIPPNCCQKASWDYGEKESIRLEKLLEDEFLSDE